VSSPLTRVGSPFTIVALSVVFALVLIGLVAADRMVERANAAQAALDARESAALVESFLTAHAEALTAFHAVRIVRDPRVPERERFSALVGALGEHLSGFRRIWMTDTSGVVSFDSTFVAGVPPLSAALDVDTITALGVDSAAAMARRSGRMQISRPGRFSSGDDGLVMLEPINDGGRFAGFIGGSITRRALLANLPATGPNRSFTVVLRSGLDTVASAGAAPLNGGVLHASAPIHLPGGGEWRADVYRVDTAHATRLALWGIGFGILLALTAGLTHERRQASRIAERSSELERLSSELLLANRAKSEFLANVSHELRTPLNAIVGFVDLLRDGVYGELAPRQVGPVQRIEASANHLRHLVDQVLDLAKMAAGRLEVHTEILDLRPFVLDVASEVESLISEKELSLSLNVGASLPRVRTDPTHLRQILVNLIGNAVKYTDAGGIAVRGRLVGPPDKLPPQQRPARPTLEVGPTVGQAPRPDALWVALQVIDSGIGIAETDRERIFEEFEQVNAGPRGDSMRRGTGLGLPISRRLARLLGGEITVESVVGRGSTFTLWLPVSPADLKRERGEPSGVGPKIQGLGDGG
jgi:signal transduction histidine kinase